MTKTASGIDIVRNAQKNDMLVIGKDTSIAALKRGELDYIFTASNAPADFVADITHYASLTQTPYSPLNVTSEDLGVACKKQFTVTVVGVRKK